MSSTVPIPARQRHQFPDIESNYLNEDVFGDSDCDQTCSIAFDFVSTCEKGHNNEVVQSHSELSDIPRIRAMQNTAGYREGISAAKATVAQEGFDEGYPLGAVIGTKAGLLLGLIEGVLASIRLGSKLGISPGEDTNTVYPRDDLDKIEILYENARKELCIQSIFSSEYWEQDGTWRFEVHGEDEIVFENVAASHPLIQKWEGILKEVECQWGIKRSILSERFRIPDNESPEDDLIYATFKSRGNPVGQGRLDW